MPVLVSTCGICTLAPGTPSREPPGVSSNASTGETRTSTMLENADLPRVPGGQQRDIGLRAQDDACLRRIRDRGLGAGVAAEDGCPCRQQERGQRQRATGAPSWPGPRAAGAGRVAPDARSWGKTGSFSNLQACVSIFPNQGFGNDEGGSGGPPRIECQGLRPGEREGRSVVQLDVELHRGLGARLEFTHVAGDRAGAAIGRRGGLTRGADGRVLDVDVGRRPGPNRS